MTITETIVWRPASEPPDTSRFVLVVMAVTGHRGFASFGGREWHYSNGDTMDIPPVYWSEPKGPQTGGQQ